MSQTPPDSLRQTRVVFLVNFLSPNLIEVLRHASTQLCKLDVLVSVDIEANRQFESVDHGLSVIRQRTWTRRKIVSHPGGYNEELYVHFPMDTLSQLRRLQPHCIVSLEMGMRSLLSSVYRTAINRRCRHVLSVYGSERSEAGRGAVRRWLRRRLLNAADIVTFNGPSCRRYLLSQHADPARMLPWDYAADPAKAYRGVIEPALPGRIDLLSVSQLIERKGILPAAQHLSAWASQHPAVPVRWTIAGTGPQTAQLAAMSKPLNLSIETLGHCDVARLKELYRQYPVQLFPTLGDEWGLVVDEALASGQVVIGSVHSQAVETLVQTGRNGWQIKPEEATTLISALDQLHALSSTELQAMREYARESVAQRTHFRSGDQFVAAVQAAMAR